MNARTRRRPILGLTLAAVVAAGVCCISTGDASAASAARSPGPDLAISQAQVAGGVRFAEAGDSLTFVFTAKDLGPGPADLAIELRSVRGIDPDRATSDLTCVLPGGALINPDGTFCEPGFVRAGQRGSSLVFTGRATGTSDVVIRACALDLGGSTDPRPSNDCRTLRVTLD